MPHLGPGTIGADYKPEPRSSGSISEIENDLPVLVTGGADNWLLPVNLLLGDATEEDLSESPAVDLRGITALTKVEEILALVAEEAMDGGITVAGVLLELFKDTSVLQRSLTAARVEIEAATTRWDILSTAFIDDVVATALLLEEGTKSQARRAGTNNADLVVVVVVARRHGGCGGLGGTEKVEDGFKDARQRRDWHKNMSRREIGYQMSEGVMVDLSPF